ncbi:PTS system D-mannitol-specific IIA component, Fru family /PTS system D-mannitol-specific IIB component, Fru family /PTS system D-mannitol-specific IIC component, Fru family [Pasteurella multocida]|uniref:PTS mannitol transporter subunit IICBA n=1 Tax=Pasteurella TaxID=745 RepID=UPI0002144E56|nr:MULTISPECIES: PTS mannitol transporter subunit IICBA [Pasteurella]EGP04776.1 PTS system mannitol-specific transporter subunit IICBA [Pasteurella multocida subsp. multocida str. Anand1_goat]AMM80974.1 PTS mannitol transporter subunit IICBA [Pasteurella multocida subsp. multocida PMTB2.1]AXQ72530.1 PTS mannitol transporter subunit IIABC [Pasteurella multocida subsp. multocida]MCH4803742.1 PTS mannitol transporter subunit IICBA [Pasteurella multocida]MCL7849963.1 PTS mannitol transporter subun
MLSANAKVKVQNFGRFLSNMVMPNIGAFIAWGFITALFIPTGWLPNETLAKLVGPMITYLLPLLIGYSGGKLIAGERGAVVGAIATAGVIVGTDIPMFLGAMIAGPTGGWAIKRFDKWADGKIKSGFEMLVNNFSSGIIGMILAILFFWLIGPAVKALSTMLAAGVDILVKAHLLPLTSIFVEPAKILFLNNAINHGIFSPLGIQQSQEFGQSIFFLIEANPGPGLGVLLAYIIFGKGTAKQTAGGATIIHFFGGIHEIYFPYVLMNPRLLLAVIAGGVSGVFTLVLFNAGLVAPASPGSIIAVLLMTPQNAIVGVLASVAIAATVSFVIASFFLKIQKEENGHSLEKMQAASKAMKSGVQFNTPARYQGVQKIFVACDAGMGSSAMGASMLRKKVKEAGLAIEVTNCAINDLPEDAQLVITHQDLTLRAKKHTPNAMHFSLNNFLDAHFYDNLVQDLSNTKVSDLAKVNTLEPQEAPQTAFVLTEKQVFLGLKAANKEEAIRFAGERLVESGFVLPSYVDAMFEREKMVSTYLGEGIAVPHGTIEAKDAVLKTGVVVCQYPEGVKFNEDEEDSIAKLVIGIAAKNNEHLQVVSAITNALDNEDAIRILSETDDVEKVLALLKA